MFKSFVLALRKVMWQQNVGEVGKFMTFQCQDSLGCYAPKIIKFSRFFTELFKK